MKPRLITWIVLALVCLALTGFALSSPQAAASRAPEALAAGGRYRLSGAVAQPEAAALSGGGYRLTSLPQGRAQRRSSGGSYRLATTSAPAGSENGCCCMYLPCVQR
jgi:hypothetical protein